MEVALVIFQVLISLMIVIVVLLQKGKGAGMGATFGGGVTSSVWGPKGPVTFLSKLTVILMVLFFANSIALTIIMGKPRFSQAVEEASKMKVESVNGSRGETN
ncbi:MAG: preprotein translocase subunit SecG [Thermosulfidibacteraceae bacterium]|jgi:preprotein translocase subunit SecG